MSHRGGSGHKAGAHLGGNRYSEGCIRIRSATLIVNCDRASALEAAGLVQQLSCWCSSHSTGPSSVHVSYIGMSIGHPRMKRVCRCTEGRAGSLSA